MQCDSLCRFARSYSVVKAPITSKVFLVIRAEGKHPVPSRTRPLSPPAPMVLLPQGSGRVGHCQENCIHERATIIVARFFICREGGRPVEPNFELTCKRCRRVVEFNREHNNTFEEMHWLCFHLEYEHNADPDVPCQDPNAHS